MRGLLRSLLRYAHGSCSRPSRLLVLPHRSYCADGSPHTSRPGPLALYRSMVKQGKLLHNCYQENVASELEGLLGRLEQYEKEMEEYHVNLANWEQSRETVRRKLLVEEAELKQQNGVWVEANNRGIGFVDKLISRRKRGAIEPGVGKMVSYLNREKKLDSLVGHRPVAPSAPKGIYLYGSVGSGKTMLMDMFFTATEGWMYLPTKEEEKGANPVKRFMHTHKMKKEEGRQPTP